MKPITSIRNLYIILLFRSVGNQIMTQKKSEPILSMGKAGREKDKKLGMFPSMMSKQPTKIRIDHPKF